MRRDIRCFRPVAWLALATAGLAAPAQAGCSRCRPLGALPFERTASAVYSEGTPDAARPLVIIGDTQRTSWLECWLGREVNDVPQRRLLAAIAEERPSGVVIVGDLVFQGDSETDWQYFDDLMAPVRRLAVPVLPLMGNHDYQGDNAEAIRNVAKRFPRLRPHRWYSMVVGHLALLWLDSNRDDLSGRWHEQAKWYAETVRAFEEDPSVRGIVVFTHHAPYTRRPDIDGNTDVQSAFVPAYRNSRKGIAFVSGHTHTYEHYVISGKHFLVSSGGGGPRPDHLLPRGARDLEDTCDLPPPRPLHYFLLAQDYDGVSICVRGLRAGSLEIEDLDFVRLPFTGRL